MELVGQLQCAVKHNDKRISTLCYATKSDINLLGGDRLEELGLSNLPTDTFCKRVQTSQRYTDTLLKQFSSLFEKGISC